jgi:hypothetical protein
MDLDSPFFRIMESIIIIGHGASIYLPPVPAYLVDMYIIEEMYYNVCLSLW